MKTTIERSWYEPIGRGAGRIHIWLVEDASNLVFGEVISAPRGPRRRSKKREIVLTVESNIPDFTGLVPGELELILPVVTRLLEALANEATAEGAHEEATKG